VDREAMFRKYLSRSTQKSAYRVNRASSRLLNTGMRGCRRHQPPDPSCRICAGRAIRRTARAILATNPRQLHAVKFSTRLSPTEFRSWRIAARNIIDHRRRQCRWCHGMQMQVWLGADGGVRGIVALGSITPEEFIEAFRWSGPSLRRIGPEEVAGVVFEAVRPGVVAEVEGRGGYQTVRFTVRPSRATPTTRARPASAPRKVIEPMPILI
jgi:hypothetical protein